jgi:hypothetical protein
LLVENCKKNYPVRIKFSPDDNQWGNGKRSSQDRLLALFQKFEISGERMVTESWDEMVM